MTHVLGWGACKAYGLVDFGCLACFRGADALASDSEGIPWNKMVVMGT